MIYTASTRIFLSEIVFLFSQVHDGKEYNTVNIIWYLALIHAKAQYFFPPFLLF